MAERDAIITVLGSDIGLAGLILVFAGFLLSKAGDFDGRRGDKFRLLARWSLVPILAVISSAFLSIYAIEGCQWATSFSLFSLKIVLSLTGIYAVIGLYFSTR
ncbi:MAG: hypothetical protein JW902_16910 [Syntrophaceae bacterium]|nr:hypothetical protein [Syntrophaceae bacterium]